MLQNVESICKKEPIVHVALSDSTGVSLYVIMYVLRKGIKCVEEGGEAEQTTASSLHSLKD